MRARSRSRVRDDRGAAFPGGLVVAPRVMRRVGVVVVTAAALAALAGCGDPEGSFYDGAAALSQQGSVQGAQRYCDPEQPEFQRVDVLSTVVLREPTEPGRTDSVGGPPTAVATLAGQFCGATEFRGIVAVVAGSDVPDDAKFRISTAVRSSGPGASTFGQLVVPAGTTDPVSYLVSTEDRPAAGVSQGAGLLGLELVALGPGGSGTLDNDSHDSVSNPRRDGGLGQDVVRQGPLTREQLRELATSTASDTARRWGVRR